jgi:hypothetical protein
MNGLIEIDVESLQRFRTNLSSHADEIEKTLSVLEENVNNLHETWDDPQFGQFETRFGEDKDFLKPLIADFRDYSENYLADRQRKAEDVIDAGSSF